MNTRSKRFFAGCLLPVIGLQLLTGCGKAAVETQMNMPAVLTERLNVGSMEASPVLTYTRWEERPSILVDQLGYASNEEKKAYLLTDSYPEDFSVIERESGRVVYQGKVNPGNGRADFSTVVEDGEYQLYCQTLGYSYPFSVMESTRETVEAHLYDSFPLGDGSQVGWSASENGENLTDAILAAQYLLLAYELRPEHFAEDKDSNGIPDLLQIVRVEIAQLLSLQERGKDVLISNEEYLLSAGVLAKYGYLYKNYDKKAATSCLQIADGYWKKAVGQGGSTEGALEYLAATELYRASGNHRYKEAVEAYLTEKFSKNSPMSRYEFLGNITYLSTKQGVDVKICGNLMKKVMRAAEETAGKEKNSFLYLTDSASTQIPDLLEEMAVLAVVDTIIANHEYNMVMKNMIHNLLGVNSAGCSLIEGIGDAQWSGQERLFERTEKAELLLICSVME